ncbi:bifunctional riboflavin kinase/FAD synthetase [Alkalimarinus alittae]|uniref:Riboflavin biosynthesis protein n=1 Tax=Alkalimarinus alittae TaxID=2961619 RepID=A0ABY6N0I8_9ALTE|nr:bifunctional riboflavin kinase/FAD synthetase [Alkalimarinus alittae]UZE95608.1 bifunctional riboflavin kinase/FAD synthetase [Alkalimarinus alittae]
MKLVRGLRSLASQKNSRVSGSKSEALSFRGLGCVATIGNFDGVHLGHKVIIEQVKDKAKKLGVPSVVVIFEPQPQEYFRKSDAPARLMRFREKLVALRELDIDYLVCLTFNDELHEMPAHQFIEQVLVSGLQIKHLVVGDDFRFGCDRAGDFALLSETGKLLEQQQKGFSVENTRTVALEGDRVSSTRVRNALDENQFALAGRLLGHPYTITGCVVHGQKLGRQLGVPTANVSLGRKVLVLKGVYAVEATLESGECLQGVANIGIRPTVDGVKPSLEVHLFGFEGSIYGQHLSVVFKHKVRDEQKFSDIERLKEQIFKDIEETKTYFDTLSNTGNK